LHSGYQYLYHCVSLNFDLWGLCFDRFLAFVLSCRIFPLEVCYMNAEVRFDGGGMEGLSDYFPAPVLLIV